MAFYIIKLTHSQTRNYDWIDYVRSLSHPLPTPTRLVPSLTTLPPNSLARPQARATWERSGPDSGQICWKEERWLGGGQYRNNTKGDTELTVATKNVPPYGSCYLFTQKNASWQLFSNIPINLHVCAEPRTSGQRSPRPSSSHVSLAHRPQVAQVIFRPQHEL